MSGNPSFPPSKQKYLTIQELEARQELEAKKKRDQSDFQLGYTGNLVGNFLLLLVLWNIATNSPRDIQQSNWFTILVLLIIPVLSNLAVILLPLLLHRPKIALGALVIFGVALFLVLTVQIFLYVTCGSGFF